MDRIWNVKLSLKCVSSSGYKLTNVPVTPSFLLIVSRLWRLICIRWTVCRILPFEWIYV